MSNLIANKCNTIYRNKNPILNENRAITKEMKYSKVSSDEN